MGTKNQRSAFDCYGRAKPDAAIASEIRAEGARIAAALEVNHG